MKKQASKLPRFVVPKQMTSIKFRTKRDKALSRQKLNRIEIPEDL